MGWVRLRPPAPQDRLDPLLHRLSSLEVTDLLLAVMAQHCTASQFNSMHYYFLALHSTAVHGSTLHRIALGLFSQYQRSANILVHILGAAFALYSPNNTLPQPTSYRNQQPTMINTLSQTTPYHNQPHTATNNLP